VSRAAIEALDVRRLLSTTAPFNGSYSQSFDSLINTGTPPAIGSTDVGPIDLSASGYTAAGYSGSETRDGWAFMKIAGTGANALFTIDAGASTAGSIYSYGAAGSSDRALGSLASGTRIHAIGLTLVNNTSSTITNFTVTYDGEQWRRGTGAANTLTFDYLVGGTFNTASLSGYTAVPGLNFTAPVTSGSAAAVDGNSAGKVPGITATITGVNWTPGQTLVLRWDDKDDSGNDDGLGLDNVNVSVPNSSQPGMLAFGNATQTVDESAGTINVPVIRSGGTGGAVAVTYTITGGTATSGSDYTAPTTGVVNFADGQSLANIPITIIDDSIVENAETIDLSLSNPTNGSSLGTQTTTEVTIHDNDGVQPTGLVLNEIVANPAGADAGAEYWELRGTPGQSLNDVYLASVEGDAGANPGNVTALFNLSNNVLGTNGLAIVMAPDAPYSPDTGTTVITNAQLDNTGGILQNGANSFLVIYSKTNPIVAQTDYDTNNDGTLESLPAGATVLDGVGWVTGTTGDVAYGAIIPQLAVDGGTIPGAATRDPNNNTPLSVGAWYAGVVNADHTYDVSLSTMNTTVGESFTPGAPNPAAVANPGVFAFGTTTYTVNENAGTITIPVYRFGGSQGGVTVDYNASDISTQGSSDYTNGSGTLTFADGVQMQNIVINIVNDNIAELPESFSVSLGNPTNGSNLNGNRTTATVNINDDDVVAPTGVLLNEISVNPPGNDQPNEFVELEGPANSLLNKVYFVSVEGDGNANQGLATYVFDFTGKNFGNNGLILLDGVTATFSPDGGTTVLNDTAFDAASTLQNGSNSFLVIFSPTPITTSQDLDTNNDGTLDLPSGASVLDGIGWLDPSTPGGKSYGATLSLSAATDPPQAASRILSNTAPNSASSWYYGKLTTITTYDPANSSPNMPANGALTPGSANLGVTDTTPPTVTGSFNVDGHPQAIQLSFSEAVTPSFTIDDITLSETNSPAFDVPAANIVLTNTTGNNYTVTFQNYPFSALPDGRYHFVIHAPGVTDTAGNPMASDFTTDFAVLKADANQDGKVNALDFNALATHFGSAGTFSQGDFNYDGTINTQDFTQLGQQFGKVLPASAPSLAAALGSLFSVIAVPGDPIKDLVP
jgi:hypothetical protein